MTEEQLQKAWQALFDRQYQLISNSFYQIGQDGYSALNLKAYIALEEKGFSVGSSGFKDCISSYV